MPVSIIGLRLEDNLNQPQTTPKGTIRGYALIAVDFSPSMLPTEFLGWAYLLNTYGGAGGNFKSSLIKRVAITNIGCVIEVPNIPGVQQGNDTFIGQQLWTHYRRAGIGYDVRFSL